MTDTVTDEVYTSIEDLPLDFYEEGMDKDDSIHSQAEPVFDAIPLTLKLAPKLLVRYVPFNREVKLGSLGRDCLAIKRALSKAGFGPWGGWGSQPTLFGPFAVRNLKAFQKKKGLPQTGVYNKATHLKLSPFFDDYGRYLMGQAPKAIDPWQTIVNTAMYGYTKRSAIHYTRG